MDLEHIQGWLSAVIRHPDGIGAGTAAEEARRHLDVPAEGLETIVARSHALTAAERIGIYHHAYHTRLIGCLRAEYPVLLQALGEELFTDFAKSYLCRYPPQSYTLARAGAQFPRWLQETRPDHDADSDVREEWPDFIIDLATLERAIAEIENGPGLEGTSQPPNADLLLGIPLEYWPALTFDGAPSLCLLSFRIPVHRYFEAVRAKKEARFPSAAPAWLAITRQDYMTRIHELSTWQHDLLDGLLASLTLGGAMERVCAPGGPSVEELMPNVRTWLCLWADLSFFARIGDWGGRLTDTAEGGRCPA